MKTSVAFIDAGVHINQGLDVLMYIYKNKTYIYFRLHNWQQPDWNVSFSHSLMNRIY